MCKRTFVIEAVHVIGINKNMIFPTEVFEREGHLESS